MGSLRKRVMSDLEVCKLYQHGFSRAEIGWRAKLYDSEILVILRANGVALRDTNEARRLGQERRALLRAKLK